MKLLSGGIMKEIEDVDRFVELVCWTILIGCVLYLTAEYFHLAIANVVGG
jgi:hypothetical protein